MRPCFLGSKHVQTDLTGTFLGDSRDQSTLEHYMQSIWIFQRILAFHPHPVVCFMFALANWRNERDVEPLSCLPSGSENHPMYLAGTVLSRKAFSRF